MSEDVTPQERRIRAAVERAMWSVMLTVWVAAASVAIIAGGDWRYGLAFAPPVLLSVVMAARDHGAKTVPGEHPDTSDHGRV